MRADPTLISTQPSRKATAGRRGLHAESMEDAHQKIKNILDRQLAAGRLSHAYLFMGPRGAGKKELAREFAGKILGLSSESDLARHPDYAVLDCSTEASAESVREFIGRIALKPFVAKKKFALISNIENLNAQGANALLKTLEEPPLSTVIVLTANTGKVLPTVVSRCQVFNINRGFKPAQNPRPNPLPKGEGAKTILDFAGKALSERLLAINQFADLSEGELKQSIEDFIYDSAATLSSAPEKYGTLSAGLKAYEDLNTNKNKKLILQGLMMKI